MSVQNQLSRLEGLRNTIRTKLVALGLASSADDLEALTTALEGVANRGAVSQSLAAGGSYTIPAGYHDGNGKVTANSLASQTDGDATAADILNGKTAYVDGAKVTGNISSKAAATITPGTSDQSIAAGQYLSGKQTIKGDANLIPENIAEGVSIFGVAGALAAGTKVATGTVTLSSSTSNIKTYTLDGLDFKPSRIIIFALSKTTTATSSTSFVLLALDSGVNAGDGGLNAPVKEWGLELRTAYYNPSGYISTDLTYGTTVTLNDDGFTVTTRSHRFAYTSSSEQCYLPQYFNYTAIE